MLGDTHVMNYTLKLIQKIKSKFIVNLFIVSFKIQCGQGQDVILFYFFLLFIAYFYFILCF